MTPNKLPPLPETWYVMKDEETPAYDDEHMRAYGGLSFDAGYAEALRQSQSLPAGAVAEVTDEQIVRFMEVALRHVEYRRGTYGPSIAEIRQGLHMAGIPALQADAREKGEDAIEAMAQVIYEAHSEQYESLVLPVWGPLLPGGTANHWRHIARKVLATQPAQASEKDNEAT